MSHAGDAIRDLQNLPLGFPLAIGYMLLAIVHWRSVPGMTVYYCENVANITAANIHKEDMNKDLQGFIELLQTDKA